MPLTRVNIGDEVECNIRGRVFSAIVTEKFPGALGIDPGSRYTYRRVSASQVKKILRKADKP